MIFFRYSDVKFPVPFCREFLKKTSAQIDFSSILALASARKSQNSLYFPVDQGIASGEEFAADSIVRQAGSDLRAPMENLAKFAQVLGFPQP